MDDRSNTTCNILISYDKTERSKRTQQAQSENCFKIFIPYMKITFGKKSKNKQDNCSNSPPKPFHFILAYPNYKKPDKDKRDVPGIIKKAWGKIDFDFYDKFHKATPSQSPPG